MITESGIVITDRVVSGERHIGVLQSAGNALRLDLGQGSANFFCEGLDSN